MVFASPRGPPRDRMRRSAQRMEGFGISQTTRSEESSSSCSSYNSDEEQDTVMDLQTLTTMSLPMSSHHSQGSQALKSASIHRTAELLNAASFSDDDNSSENEDDTSFYEQIFHDDDDDEEDISDNTETDDYSSKHSRRQRLDGSARAVWMTKTLVLVVLLWSAGTSGALTYVLLAGDETDDFRHSFENSAEEIISMGIATASTIFSSIKAFAALYPAYAEQIPNTTLPQVTMQDFETFSRGTRYVAKASLLAFSPYLTSPEERLPWEDYARANQWWIHRGFELSNPDYQGHPADHDPMTDFIWQYRDAQGEPQQHSGSLPMSPLWQMSPPPNDPSMVNHDLIGGSEEFEKLFADSIHQGKSTLTRPIDVGAVFGTNSLASDTPQSMFLEPVMEPTRGSSPSKVTGSIVSVIPWDSFLSNLLPEKINGIVVVVESCGMNSTFTLNGPDVTFTGPGDLHNDVYDDMAVSAPFTVEGMDGSSVIQSSTCEYILHVFPSSQLEESFQTRLPLLSTIIVVCIFVFAVLVFIVYDFVVTMRQNKAENSANRTGAIVEQFFPETIRQQLFSSPATRDANKVQKTTTEHHRKSDHRPVERRPSDVGMDDTTRSFAHESEDDHIVMESTKAIADLYPATTILFAEIPAFTAWSSIREPTHIFMLLEAIFQAFDEIAKKRRVFKVETVGDCYVAAVGVPDANENHAIVMARFARDCMQRFSEIVADLEMVLGPDTSELGLRVGLHSGPVTAGVLRGDRARFQLFGDTMNTTARVETSGHPDCIHVSEQTAALITAAGKGNWLVHREDQVKAKGKGILVTYWLKTKRRLQSSEYGADTDADTSAYSSSDASESESSNSDSSSSTYDEEEIEAMASALGAHDSRLSRSYVPSPSVAQRRSGQLGPRPSLALALKNPVVNKERVTTRLVAWNCELLSQLLKQIVARREATQARKTSQLALSTMASRIGEGITVVEEVAEIITMPDFNEKASVQGASGVTLSADIQEQLGNYVERIARMYRDNPFHNFEHASHVTMSVSKLLSRIVAPSRNQLVGDEKGEEELHDHTYGITSDPLTQFAVVLSALIHDVDHRGVPNFVLAQEDRTLASTYKGKSIAEQNSVDVAWSVLMEADYDRLRECIFADISELRRFRQLLVNSVIATDIFDKELSTLRKKRWDKAFAEDDSSSSSDDVHRKATIVIEHIIQASDVAHTMQHWQVYLRWNERLFKEMYQAYQDGRAEKDPSLNWYEGEIGFFDNYIIPLAKKLKTCGVFGVSSDEYLNYAQHNRRDWEAKGRQVVEEMVAALKG